jgi:hypothetical protein
MQGDSGAGMDPIDFRVHIQESRFEWITGTNITVSHIRSALPDAAGVMFTFADGKTLAVRMIQNGISIRDSAAGKTLFCHKEEPDKANQPLHATAAAPGS